MHPDLCRYTSAAFYDGKLGGVDGLGRQENSPLQAFAVTCG